MPKSINFFKGHPTLSLLPKAELADAFRFVIDGDDLWDFELDPNNRHPLQYGTDPGNLTVRRAVADWSNGKFGRKTLDVDSINLTAGSSFGAANILSACTSPDVTVRAFVVSPTYFLINYAFIDADLGEKMTAVEETPDGEYEIDMKYLESQLEQFDKENGLSPVAGAEINIVEDPTARGLRKFYRYVMYLVPTFSNPGGLTYSKKTRIKLLELARKHDLLLISDDVYDHLSYDGTPPVAKLNHFDEDTLPSGWKFGNTVSNSSFSKIIAPGLRVGWQETASKYLAQQLATTGANKSGGTPGQLNSAVVQRFIESGTLDEVISGYVKTYSSRAAVVKKAVLEYLPPSTKLYGGDGGYFLWVQIESDGVDLASTVDRVKAEHSVIIPEGTFFEVHGDKRGWGKIGARLCVALLEEKELEEGIKKWGEVLKHQYPQLYALVQDES